MRTPPRPSDFTITQEDTQYSAHWGETYRAYENRISTDNGSIPSCAGRQCTFFRRGECWIGDFNHKCVWPYYWMKMDKDGNVLDRDGFVCYTKEQADKIEENYKSKKKGK